jgi:hypothetical protein
MISVGNERARCESLKVALAKRYNGGDCQAQDQGTGKETLEMHFGEKNTPNR